MNNWTVMAPHARLAFRLSNAARMSDFHKELGRIAGVKQKNGLWTVPLNAVVVVNNLASAWGAQVTAAAWAHKPPETKTWDQIKAELLASGEVRPWVLEGFLNSYQQDGITFGWARAGVHFWHSTGCLVGDTEISINRGGKGFRVRLDDLVAKFNGELPEKRPGTNRRRWNLSIPTRAQCFKEGFILLNNLVRAFPTGEKEVFLLRTTAGQEIKATADHRFLTVEHGWCRLNCLAPGDLVVVRGEQKNKERKPKIIYRMRGVRHHPYASVALAKYSEAMCRRGRYRPGYTYEVHRVPEHRLVVEAHKNGLTLGEFLQRCRKGGKALDGLEFLDPAMWAVHHKNHDPQDNRIENLELLTHAEHARLHSQQAWKNVAINADEAEIESITSCGVQKTYDLSMESPYNNYVANGFVVHNSGKTLTGIITALSVPGPVVVVTRAASRIQYAREIERFLNVRAHVVRPASHPGPTKVQGETYNEWRARNKGQGMSPAEMGQAWKDRKAKLGVDPPRGIPDYLKECAAAGTRPFIVVGWESLKDHYAELCAVSPGAAIFDESHRGKSTKRYDVEHLPDLPEDPSEARKQAQEDLTRARANDGFIKDTADGRKMFMPVLNRATAAARLARTAQKRICTTATPVKDRVRDLWAQLDLAEPNSWGSSSAFRRRYCDMKPGRYGGMDDRGESNIDELNLRKREVAHILSYAETHQHLPPKRRQSVYIAPEDQRRPSGGFAKQLREASKRGATALLEAKLAQAASKKRRAVLTMVEDHLSSGQKITLFTARRRDCDELGELILKRQFVKKNKVKVWAAHGDQSTAARQDIVDEYMAHPGPCALVGTGHAFGESLNIDDTDAVFFVMLPYTPGQLRQWEGRFHRASTKKKVVIYYVIAEDTVDEHVASILIDKLPAVETIAEDTELGEAEGVLSGIDPDETPEEFAAAVLDLLDL